MPVLHRRNRVWSVAGRRRDVALVGADITDRGQPNSVATLGGDGLVPSNQLPPGGPATTDDLPQGNNNWYLNGDKLQLLLSSGGRDYDFGGSSLSNIHTLGITNLDASGITTLGNIETGIVTITGGVVTADSASLNSATVGGTLTATALVGDGSGITGITEAHVTNLTTDLAGKASTSHVHSAADITSGTFVAGRIPATLNATTFGGAITGTTASFSGAITGTALTATTGTFSGAVTLGSTTTFAGAVSGADTAGLMALTGNQTVAGTKTFSGTILLAGTDIGFMKDSSGVVRVTNSSSGYTGLIASVVTATTLAGNNVQGRDTNFFIESNAFDAASGFIFRFNSGATFGGSYDVSLYRAAAGILNVGGGAASGNGQLDMRARNFTVATLPVSAAGTKGRLAFATDGRKNGEGAAAGTGVLCYDDGTAWRRVSDDTTAAA